MKKNFQLNCKVKNLWNILARRHCAPDTLAPLAGFIISLKGNDNEDWKEEITVWRKRRKRWREKTTLKRCGEKKKERREKGFDAYTHATHSLLHLCDKKGRQQSGAELGGKLEGKSLANLRAFDLQESFAFFEISFAFSPSLFFYFIAIKRSTLRCLWCKSERQERSRVWCSLWSEDSCLSGGRWEKSENNYQKKICWFSPPLSPWSVVLMLMLQCSYSFDCIWRLPWFTQHLDTSHTHTRHS